jgi:hypothetical protein
MHPDPDALPFLDEHGVEIAAPPEVVWESLCRVSEGSFSSPRAARFARLVGCEETAPVGIAIPNTRSSSTSSPTERGRDCGPKPAPASPAPPAASTTPP